MADAEEPRAANVIEALCRVMRDLPAIGKEGKADPKQGGYAYRGIEQITPYTQDLCAKHGVVFTPHLRSWEIRELTVNGKPWMDVIEEIEYTVYGPGGIEDRITVGPLLAIGRDNSDKGSNKCVTQAMKYALVQALQIADAAADADGQTHEADPRWKAPALPEGCEWTGPAKTRVVEAAEGDKDMATKAWQTVNPEVTVIDPDHKHVSKLDVDLAVAEAERLLVLATEGDDEEERDAEDQAEAEEQAAEQAAEQPELLPDNGHKATDEARQKMQPKGEGS